LVGDDEVMEFRGGGEAGQVRVCLGETKIVESGLHGLLEDLQGMGDVAGSAGIAGLVVEIDGIWFRGC